MKRLQLDGVIHCRTPQKLTLPDPSRPWNGYYVPFSTLPKESVLKTRCRSVAAFFIRRL
jgi:hypothetical protein